MNPCGMSCCACVVAAVLAACPSPARAADAAPEVPSRREKELESLALAVRDLTATFGARYPKGAEYLARAAALARDKDASQADIDALRSEALLANPLLGFGTLLLIERGEDHLSEPVPPDAARHADPRPHPRRRPDTLRGRRGSRR